MRLFFKELSLEFILTVGTTDAVFLEKPQYYYLVIDMMTFSPERATCPGLQLSVRSQMVTPKSRRASYRLSTVRFTWSDVKLGRPNSSCPSNLQ